MGKIRGHLDAGGGGPYHFSVASFSGSTGGATTQNRDMGLFSGHGEADSMGLQGFFVAGERESDEEARTWRGRTWPVDRGEIVLKTAGTQDIWAYINMLQATKAQWMALCTMIEVCTQEDTGYKGGGQRQAL